MPTAMALVPTTRRVAIAALVAALAVTAPAAPASGVDVIPSTGETGAWEIPTTP